MQKFTIDGHNFTVIANDFVPVQPYTTSVVTLGVAQRTDIIVRFPSIWMRGLTQNLLGRSRWQSR